MKKVTLLSFLLVSLVLSAQDLPAYKIFSGKGKKADYRNIIKAAEDADVVFFGELHDNPIAHWLELEIVKSLFAIKGKDLNLAAEMFETDNQLLIDEYFAGLIRESSFESEVRKWNNYDTDYKPLLNFARDSGLKFIASNIPRRYASMVSSGGFEALEKTDPEARKFFAPLPVDYDPELPCYKDMMSMSGGAGMHTSENLPKAQAIKDATMAHSILKYWKEGQVTVHFNGSYHSDRYQGIIWYLKKYNPAIRVVTITTILQDDLDKMDESRKEYADFVVVVPNSMTRTYK